ncbi:hypothetical protein [Polycladomyces zharkentensis]|nr:hypothetical protein [Polycladomyces sp. WAk]
MWDYWYDYPYYENAVYRVLLLYLLIIATIFWFFGAFDDFL